MENKKYKPLFDKMILWIYLPTVLMLTGATILGAIAPWGLIIMIGVDIFTLYFLVTPFFGYVELRESTLYIKYGFFLKREIPYNKIRGTVKDRKFYSESMLSLKNALTHVNIKYNVYDVTTVSVVDNDGFIEELERRIGNKD